MTVTPLQFIASVGEVVRRDPRLIFRNVPEGFSFQRHYAPRRGGASIFFQTTRDGSEEFDILISLRCVSVPQRNGPTALQMEVEDREAGPLKLPLYVMKSADALRIHTLLVVERIKQHHLGQKKLEDRKEDDLVNSISRQIADQAPDPAPSTAGVTADPKPASKVVEPEVNEFETEPFVPSAVDLGIKMVATEAAPDTGSVKPKSTDADA